MKKTQIIFSIFLALIFLAGCTADRPTSSASITNTPSPTASPTPTPSTSSTEESSPPETSATVNPDESPEVVPTAEPEASQTLIIYFSCTGTTKQAAEKIHTALPDADLQEIIPAQPYTAEDLEYYTDCRADREQNDDSARPEIAGDIENWDQYDTVFLGYPIWHGRAPRIIQTFLESYDFSGKTVIPFCTSHSSPYSDSGLQESAQGATWITGRNLKDDDTSAVAQWVTGLELTRK